MNIKIKAIYVSRGHDFKGRHGKGRLDHGFEAVSSIECVAGKGIRGDRYFDYKPDFKGQITFFDDAVYQRVRDTLNLKAFDPGLFRRNVLTTGIDLNELIGQRFSLQGIEFEGSEECAPCYWMDTAIAPGTEALLKGYGGLRARIRSSGTLQIPDTKR